MENARKAPLIIDFIAEVKQNVLAGNDVSSDNPTIELLDRCKTLEEAMEDPLVLELIDKLKNEVSAKAGKTIYWEDVLEGNPKIPTLLGYALLSEIGVPENYDLRREILDEHRDVPVLLFYSLLSQIVNSPGCEVLCGKFESKKKASKASARNIYRKPALDKKRK